MELPPMYSMLSVLPWAGGTPVRCGTAAFSGKAASTILVDITRAVSYLKYFVETWFSANEDDSRSKGRSGLPFRGLPGIKRLYTHHPLAPRPQKSLDLCIIPVFLVPVGSHGIL